MPEGVRPLVRKPLGAMASVVAGAIILATFVGVLRARLLLVQVEGVSMTPTFDSGDRVLMMRTHGRMPTRGDIVALDTRILKRAVFAARELLEDAPSLLIKRVTALPGDFLTSACDGELHERSSVPDGYIVVQGDSSRSLDSRVWGPVPAECVCAVAVWSNGCYPGLSSAGPL